MKKIILTCVAAMGIFMVSCSSNPADKVVKLMDKATEQVKDANGDPSKIMEISANVLKEANDLQKDLTPEQLEEISNNPDVQKATEKFQEACKEAGEKMMNMQ